MATNQAGIAWQALTQQAKYPLPSSLSARFDEIAELLPPLRHARWFAAIHDTRVHLSQKRYAELVEALSRANQTLELHVSAEPDWRKPQPGILLAACRSYDVAQDAAIFVGDIDSDFEAAKAAGMDFATAKAFFAEERL